MLNDNISVVKEAEQLSGGVFFVGDMVELTGRRLVGDNEWICEGNDGLSRKIKFVNYSKDTFSQGRENIIRMIMGAREKNQKIQVRLIERMSNQGEWIYNICK